MTGPRVTIVRSSELARVDSLSPSDFLDGPEACHRCGFAPQDVEKRGRANPRVELLTPASPDESDPLRRSRRECRDRAACDSRRDYSYRQGAGA